MALETTRNKNNIDKSRAKFEGSIQYAESWVSSIGEQDIITTRKMLKVLGTNERLVGYLKNNIDKKISKTLNEKLKTVDNNQNILKSSKKVLNNIKIKLALKREEKIKKSINTNNKKDSITR